MDAKQLIDASLPHKYIKVQSKTWWANLDGRVRDSHRAAHGETVPYDTPFSVGGDLLRFAGDDSRGAGTENLCNCRCEFYFRRPKRLHRKEGRLHWPNGPSLGRKRP